MVETCCSLEISEAKLEMMIRPFAVENTSSKFLLISISEGVFPGRSALEESLSSALEGIKELVLDLSGLEYLSSAGLRVVLSTFKTVSAAEGKMTICNANEMVSKVFELTGFGNIVAIE